MNLTDEQRHDRAMSEAALKLLVLELARKHGWRVHHQVMNKLKRPQRASTGYPDLTLARAGRVIWMELKKELGELEPEQAVWLAALPATDTYIVHPSDYRSGLVERLLT